MTLILTGSPTRYGEPGFTRDNGFLAAVKRELAEAVARRRGVDGARSSGKAGGRTLPRVLLISAAPDDRGFTESVRKGMSQCIHRSGIRTKSIVMLDRRNQADARRLVDEADWVILCGGHTPTQNAFVHDIDLKDLLEGYEGLIMGCSAGSMNCADLVYAHPELSGEAIDPDYKRWLRGAGLTDINIIPHYGQVRGMEIDGKKLFEDIVIPDSIDHKFYTFPDGGYILCRDGRSTLHGTAWEIFRGGMRQISQENKSYSFMNLIFISPHFPHTYWHFCAGLKNNGVNVLGIADTPYENLPWELRNSLTDYYMVQNLEDYGQVYRAVAWFAHKWGKIDWIESNNEYWLEQDARLRTDFNVVTGIQNNHIAAIKNKSEMKKYYALAGVPTARQIKASEGLEKVLEFGAVAGYPLIAKPDNGVGASGTYKLHSADEVKSWFAEHPESGLFVIEEFITGLLVSYDAVYNDKQEPLFESMGVYPTPIMEIVNKGLDSCYYVDKTVPAALRDAGRRTVKAFGIRSRFVHLEFFKTDRDREGLGPKGTFVGLEVNMRPAGGYTPDMMNFAHSTDVYQIWADMVAFGERHKDQGEQYFCAYASRRDSYSYLHSHGEILAFYSDAICMCDRMPAALSGALGDQVYMARFKEKKEIEPFFKYVCERG